MGQKLRRVYRERGKFSYAVHVTRKAEKDAQFWKAMDALIDAAVETWEAAERNTMTIENDVKCPSSAKDALELWDHGERLAAFTVESDGATQSQLYDAAFEMIRAGMEKRPLRSGLNRVSYLSMLTKREIDVAHSIAHVAMLKGWASMVQQHVADGHIERLTVKKP